MFRLNFRIGCDFSTANHSPLHLLGQVEPSRRTISPSESSGSPRLFSKLLSNLTPQLMHLNSRTVLAIPVSPVSAVGTRFEGNKPEREPTVRKRLKLGLRRQHEPSPG